MTTKTLNNQLKLLRLGGSPYDIGYQHGKDGKDGIRDFLNTIIQHGREYFPGLTREKAIAHVSPSIPFIETYTPHLAKEIAGIAEGAAITIQEAYLIQARAEFTQISTHEPLIDDGCTSFGIPGEKTEGGEVWVGQNLDLSPIYQGFGIMLHITPDKGPAILCYSQIGSVAHAGINSAGIGLVINALYSSGWGPGIPRPLLYRQILERENIDDAVKVVIGAKRASSCNYLFSQPTGRMANLEVTPEHFGLTEFAGEIVVHTNHYSHPDMIKFEKRPKEKLRNSQFREDRFKQLLSNQPEKLSLANLKNALTDHQIYPMSVCAHAEGNPWNIATIASIIAEPAKGQMHVSLGQGCVNQYATYFI